MPMRVRVGLSKKVGLTNYGSAGASCDVEVELDGGLLQSDLDGFHRHVRNAFVACRQAVQDELARHVGNGPTQANGHHADDHRLAGGGGNNGDGQTQNGHVPNGHAPLSGNAHHRISEKQLEYAAQLAGKIRDLGVRGLEGLTHKMFGKPLAELSSLDGSSLIDVLKEVKAGKLDLGAAAKGASP